MGAGGSNGPMVRVSDWGGPSGKCTLLLQVGKRDSEIHDYQVEPVLGFHRYVLCNEERWIKALNPCCGLASMIADIPSNTAVLAEIGLNCVDTIAPTSKR